jgi:hypothetical protein
MSQPKDDGDGRKIILKPNLEALERAENFLRFLKEMQDKVGSLELSTQAWHQVSLEEMLLLLKEVTFLLYSFSKDEYVATLRRNPEIISTGSLDELNNEELIKRSAFRQVLHSPDPELQNFLQNLEMELERRLYILRTQAAGKQPTDRDLLPFVQVSGQPYMSDKELESNLLFRSPNPQELQVVIFYRARQIHKVWKARLERRLEEVKRENQRLHSKILRLEKRFRIAKIRKVLVAASVVKKKGVSPPDTKPAPKNQQEIAGSNTDLPSKT